MVVVVRDTAVAMVVGADVVPVVLVISLNVRKYNIIYKYSSNITNNFLRWIFIQIFLSFGYHTFFDIKNRSNFG